MGDNMNTYLITGGAGFIGSNFIHYLFEKYSDIRVINFDKLTYAGNLENLRSIQDNNNYQFINGDICDYNQIIDVFNDNDIDFIVNFAAESHVDRSILEPESFVKANVLGTVNLLNAAKLAWETEQGFKEGKKFVQISTDEVYGSLGETGFFTEETPLDPHSPYSASKASADLIVKSYYDTYKMPVYNTRCSNNYGAFQFPEKLIPLIISNCIKHKAIPVYGDGMNVRDWIYVIDHCKAIDMVMKNGRSGQVYNIGGHNERTNIQIVRTIIEYLNKKFDALIDESLITYVEDRKGHDRRYAIDAAKLKEELGWEPMTSFEEGIKKTISWYLKNQSWLENAISGEYQNYYKAMYENR